MATLLSRLPTEYTQTPDIREILCRGLGMPTDLNHTVGCSLNKSTFVNSFSVYRDSSDLASELHPIPSVAAGGFYGCRMPFKQAAEPQDPIETLAREIAMMPDARRLIEQAIRAQEAITPALDTHTTAFAKVVSIMKKFAPVSLASFTSAPADKLESRLDSFSSLKAGWDSYDAEPPTGQAIEAARTFLSFLRKIEKLPDQLNPTVVGGVGFTFRQGKRSVYIEFRNTGNTHAAFIGTSARPRVAKVSQDRVGYAEVMAQAEKHLYEQSARRDEA